jgi:hypothetical protein
MSFIRLYHDFSSIAIDNRRGRLADCRQQMQPCDTIRDMNLLQLFATTTQVNICRLPLKIIFLWQAVSAAARRLYR